METVDEAVIDLHRHPQFLAAIFLAISAPCDAGDGVVFVKIPLVGAAGQIKPRRGGNVDQRVRLAVLIQKALLCCALSFCSAAELVQRAGLGQCDDVELLTAGLQVGQAGDALIQKSDLAVPDGIAEIHHAVHGIGHEIAESIIKGNAAGFGVGVEIGHVHPEGDTVKWLRHSGKEPEQLCPRPRGHVDFMHGRFLHPPCFYPAHRTAL